MHTLLIYFRAIAFARCRKSALGRRRERERERGGQEGERKRERIFDRRRDAAVSFISRQEQDPARVVSPANRTFERRYRHAPSVTVLGFLRCGPVIFFCSALKPSVTREEGGGRGGRRRSIVDRGGERNNVPGAISQIGSVGAPTVL